jgi:hypothetical protein
MLAGSSGTDWPASERSGASIDGRGIVKPDSIMSFIPSRLLKQLGVSIRGQRFIEYPDGGKAKVGISFPIVFEIMGRDTIEEALIAGDDLVIGSTILSKLDLHADCAGRRLLPNPAHPDQPVTKVK